MAGRKIFQDSVTPLPEQSGLTHNGLMINAAEQEHREEAMTVLFSLELPAGAQADLEAKSFRSQSFRRATQPIKTIVTLYWLG
jgi:hypothetical protein